MAIKKGGKNKASVMLFINEPNAAGIVPEMVGQIGIDTTLKIFYVACGLTGTDWGTGGTIGG